MKSIEIHILGLGSYPDEIQPPIVPPHNPIDTVVRQGPHEIPRNNIDLENHPETPDSVDINEHNQETKSTSGSSSRETSWKTKRLMFTYFLPIVMAWFGGSIGSAVADLL